MISKPSALCDFILSCTKEESIDQMWVYLKEYYAYRDQDLLSDDYMVVFLHKTMPLLKENDLEEVLVVLEEFIKYLG